jgi:hypothetical protein
MRPGKGNADDSHRKYDRGDEMAEHAPSVSGSVIVGTGLREQQAHEADEAEGGGQNSSAPRDAPTPF